MYGCHSILECYNLFSGVKLSIRSFCFVFVSGMGFSVDGSLVPSILTTVNSAVDIQERLELETVA